MNLNGLSLIDWIAIIGAFLFTLLTVRTGRGGTLGLLVKSLAVGGAILVVYDLIFLGGRHLPH